MRTQSTLTAPGDEVDASELHSPLLDLVTAAAWAGVLVASVWPLLSKHPNAASHGWILGGFTGLTGFCWSRSGAYVKREALQRRRLARVMPVAWYHWSWSDYRLPGRFWVVAFWVFGLLTAAVWFQIT